MPCCGESNDFACLAMFKSLTEIHHRINHMIIFNDSIRKFYQCSILGFYRGISMFFSICLGKKNAEIIKFLGVFRKYFSQNKIYFCSRKKSNVLLNKKVVFVFVFHNAIFITWFHNADHWLYYPQMSVLSFHTFLLCLYQSLRNRT